MDPVPFHQLIQLSLRIETVIVAYILYRVVL